MRHGVLSAILAGLVLLGSACSTDARPIGESIDLSAFSKAWSSGDPDLVRDFYTEDAIIFPIGVDETKGEAVAGGWGTGADIDREVSQHFGGTYEIFDAVRVGDIATYTWRWDLGPFIVTGADILHFQDDLIWRQFIDYQAGE